MPIAVAALRNLRAVIADVIAVVRPADSDAQQRLQRLLSAEGAQLVRVCRQADAGMGHSLACGVRARSEARGWVIALADMPAVSPSTIAAVRDAIAHGCDSAMRRCISVGAATRWDSGARAATNCSP